MIVVLIGKVGHVFGGRINHRNDSGFNWKGWPVYLEALLHKRLNKGDPVTTTNFKEWGILFVIIPTL